MLEPPYLMTEVPRARKDLETSVVLKVSARHATLLPITACTAMLRGGGETRELKLGRRASAAPRPPLLLDLPLPRAPAPPRVASRGIVCFRLLIMTDF